MKMVNQSFKLKLPEKVSFIIHTLEQSGFEAYAVGGCVRDSLLGRVPDDWDITTSARPEEVKALFRRTIDTGIEHGTVTVMLEREGFEVTTYRIDGEYMDNRHPKEVIFTPELREDLRRRDFTINAMAYNDRRGLVDKFQGKEDLRQGIIRCVGDARERFTEDALRMLRAVRFAAQLQFQIEESTTRAICQLSGNLQNISAERIQTELVKLLVSNHPDYLREAYKTGILDVILPEISKEMVTPQNNPHHQYNVGEHTLQSLLQVPNDKVLRLTMLLHDVGKTETLEEDENGIHHFHQHGQVGELIAKMILRRLKFDNHTIDQVTKLVRLHDYYPTLTEKGVRKAVSQIGTDIFPLLFPVKRADILAQSMYQREEKLERLALLENYYREIMEKKECVSMKMLAVSGKDLILEGREPGRELGLILQQLLDYVLEDPARNTKETLLKYAKQL